MWINLERFIKWKSSLQNGSLWYTESNGWRWRVYSRNMKGNRRWSVFRLLSPEGHVYEKKTVFTNRSISDHYIAETIIDVIIMDENLNL